MSLPHSLIDAHGQPIPIGRQLGSAGGEGAVYAVSSDPTVAVKIYHLDKRKPEVFEKLRAIIAVSNAKLLSVTAWPKSIVLDASSRAAVGFTMPLLADFKLIQELYNPVQRLKVFPRAGWAFQVRAAANLAAAFDEIHQVGCLMGDVNERNEMVTDKALVRLIDCDSCQIQANGKQYLCEGGVAHYTPPELQGKSLRGLVRTVNHDRFGLAVLIYQLLFVGKHPYMGLHKDDASFDQLIAQFRFAQGPAARSVGMELPPYTPTFADIPSEIGALFRRSFERGSELGNRPNAKDWHSALGALEQNIIKCTADAGHQYWKGAGGCTWCRLASHGGPEYYFGVDASTSSFEVDHARLNQILARLNRLQLFDLSHEHSSRNNMASVVPKPVPDYFTRLYQSCMDLRKKHQEDQERERVREAQEDADRKQREKQLKDSLARKVEERSRPFMPRLREMAEVAAAEESDRSLIRRILLGVTIAGALLIPLGLYKALFALIGLVVSVGFGSWLAVYISITRSTPAHRELSRGRRQIRQIEREGSDEFRRAQEAETVEKEKLQKARESRRKHSEQRIKEADDAYQAKWDQELQARCRILDLATSEANRLIDARRVATEKYVTSYREITATVHSLARDFRKLASQYEDELRRLLAMAEKAAKLRHMRLHLIADAEIDKIGAGRKQVLAASGICTAADIEEDKIRMIKGFGDTLTWNLIAWKEEIERQFRFSPSPSSSSPEQRALGMTYYSRQKQMFAELERHLSSLSTLGPATQDSIQKLNKELVAVQARVEQAKADVKLLQDAAKG